MPKLYEYFGLMVLFYSNEHESIHVHGKYQDKESKMAVLHFMAENTLESASLLKKQHGRI